MRAGWKKLLIITKKPTKGYHSPKYKDMAKSEIEKLEKELEKLANNRDILFIITCTEKKIWAEKDAPKYVPAKEAYTGSTMKKWLKSEESKKYP